MKFQSLKLGFVRVKKLYEELLVSTELVDNQVMDKIFVGKVNVMPLEAIDQKIEEFRSLSGDELKEPSFPLQMKQPMLSKRV